LSATFNGIGAANYLADARRVDLRGLASLPMAEALRSHPYCRDLFAGK
jgi:hypothetical protein